MDLAMAIAIASFVIALLGLFFGRKDKSNKDTGDYQYKMGQIDAKLSTISQQIENLSNKWETFDRELDTKIEKAIENHERVYHSRGE